MEGARPAWPFAFFGALSPKPKGKGLLVLLTLLPLIKTAIESAEKWPAGKRFTHIEKGKRIGISRIAHHLMGKAQVFPALLLQHST